MYKSVKSLMFCVKVSRSTWNTRMQGATVWEQRAEGNIMRLPFPIQFFCQPHILQLVFVLGGNEVGGLLVIILQ
jgi:hypothetical protein